MSSVATVEIHPSQFPDRVRAELLDCLRARRVNHKFHYDSVKQTMKWLALHEAYSPARTEVDCALMYDRCFSQVLSRIPQRPVHLVGLGCGGGQKDARLIQAMLAKQYEVFYTPLDVSTAMVLVARNAVLDLIPPSRCFPFVCDLALTDDLAESIESKETAAAGQVGKGPTAARLFTLFGMIPNFEPQAILPKLGKWIGKQDYLLLSANLAPGADYAAGVERVLPLYDNALTREWLMMFLLDLGIDQEDGGIRFVVEDAQGLKRITAYFNFTRAREIQIDAERFHFAVGDSIRLFFSYRHTPALVRSVFEEHGFQVLEQWIAKSGEEGVFLMTRPARNSKG